jgi:hypothetical protein
MPSLFVSVPACCNDKLPRPLQGSPSEAFQRFITELLTCQGLV